MKRLLGSIFALQLLIIVFWGIYIFPEIDLDKAIWIDEKSGIKVDQTDPVKTVIAYYSLINNKSFEAAQKLMTAAGQKVMTPEKLEKINSEVILKETNIVKYYPVRKVGKKFALVGNIRTIGQNGAALVGITILRLSKNGWQITTSEDFEGLDKNTLLALFDKAIAVSDEILKDKELKLTEKQYQQVVNQASSIKASLSGVKQKI